MDVAREQGARGGTILTGRGVAKEGGGGFLRHPAPIEKEILMMVVEKSVRIRFSMPSTRRWAWASRRRASRSLPTAMAGLVKEHEADEDKGIKKE